MSGLRALADNLDFAQDEQHPSEKSNQNVDQDSLGDNGMLINSVEAGASKYNSMEAGEHAALLLKKQQTTGILNGEDIVLTATNTNDNPISNITVAAQVLDLPLEFTWEDGRKALKSKNDIKDYMGRQYYIAQSAYICVATCGDVEVRSPPMTDKKAAKVKACEILLEEIGPVYGDWKAVRARKKMNKEMKMKSYRGNCIARAAPYSPYSRGSNRGNYGYRGNYNTRGYTPRHQQNQQYSQTFQNNFHGPAQGGWNQNQNSWNDNQNPQNLNSGGADWSSAPQTNQNNHGWNNAAVNRGAGNSRGGGQNTAKGYGSYNNDPYSQTVPGNTSNPGQPPAFGPGAPVLHNRGGFNYRGNRGYQSRGMPPHGNRYEGPRGPRFNGPRGSGPPGNGPRFSTGSDVSASNHERQTGNDPAGNWPAANGPARYSFSGGGQSGGKPPGNQENPGNPPTSNKNIENAPTATPNSHNQPPANQNPIRPRPPASFPTNQQPGPPIPRQILNRPIGNFSPRYAYRGGPRNGPPRGGPHTQPSNYSDCPPRSFPAPNSFNPPEQDFTADVGGSW